MASPLTVEIGQSGARRTLASVLLGELRGLGFDRSYPTLAREIRKLGLRPACSCCRAGTQTTVEIPHDPGEELQLDWLELRETPWARPAYVLVGVLSHSGRLRGVFSEGQSFAHLAAALDQLLRRFGATARRWRTDRMATFVYPGTDRLRPEAAGLAKHYGVTRDHSSGGGARSSRSSHCKPIRLRLVAQITHPVSPRNPAWLI